MSGTGELTFIEQKKQQIAEQKRMVRNPGNDGLPEKALGIDDANFAMTAESNKLLIACEIAGEQLYSPMIDSKGNVVGYDGLLSRIVNLCKIHQLGTNLDPTSVGFRKQLIEVIKAESGGGSAITQSFASKI